MACLPGMPPWYHAGYMHVRLCATLYFWRREEAHFGPFLQERGGLRASETSRLMLNMSESGLETSSLLINVRKWPRDLLLSSLDRQNVAHRPPLLPRPA